MKSLIVAALCLLTVSAAFADDAQLRIKIAGPIKNNRYFLCMSGTGCASILAGDKGKTFPLETGIVNRIFVVDGANMSMHPQALPASCKLNVNGNQTLTVSGKIVNASNGHVQLDQLNCSIA